MIQIIDKPKPGHLFHGVYPGKHDGIGDDVWPEDLAAYEQKAIKQAAWVYFSNEWSRSRLFPRDKCEWIRSRGAVPFIRLMLRGFLEQADAGGCRCDQFRLDRILQGEFDEDLMEWGKSAATFGSPVIVEYGTECNIKSFCWNGTYHGKGSKSDPAQQVGDGPKKFADAYWHIHEVLRKAGAENLTWVFHINGGDDPGDQANLWNQFEYYYPGKEVVDWIGVSVYGAQKPDDPDPAQSFSSQMANVYARILRMDPTRPVVVAEFGCVDQNQGVKAGDWAKEAFDAMLGRVQTDWQNLIGFSWWNSRWRNDWDAPTNDPTTDSNMLVQENDGLIQAFQSHMPNPRIDAHV